MNPSKETNLVVCSVMIRPARLLVFYKLRTWIDQVVKVVVHTFAIEQSKYPLNPNNPDGYWYCSGDFCDIDEAGVCQHLSQADIHLAKCLVSPNIKDDHPDRADLVISGEYGINYVCHNITNRVLYSTKSCETLIDLDIKTTGYELVVKSVLGVYGQNKVDWESRKQRCDGDGDGDGDGESCDPTMKGLIVKNKPNRTREDEILKIHLRATGGNLEKARNLTDALNESDDKFYETSNNLLNQFESGMLDEVDFHSKMFNSCAVLFSETKSAVGRTMTQKIYPECNIAIEIESDVHEVEKKVLVARA